MGQQLRVLVAEDELIVGYDLCDTVAEAGYLVEGPFDDLSSAMLAYQKMKPDVAILDVQLGDGIVYPLAEQMMAEDVPVIFHSGQITPQEVASRFPQAQALSKPCPPAEVLETVHRAAQHH
ncbi:MULTISPECIES: response regulator [Qipengyuania]|uniref:Response regulator n=2 Tax=Qipengyuania TaxID=1855416 RepID=A0A9Q3RZF3_9SPHN|nr:MULTISPECIES: response regulator [Qipengyuania]MBY6129296.1 response regulator [Qipengyuania aquimaris]MBY6217161.1 response regulator [Qipengyuania aquimaris]QZD92219.1 response regulator [Qipengyuania xiapuensis]UOR14304.1 response regulator [Qipengyuania aquimaris]